MKTNIINKERNTHNIKVDGNLCFVEDKIILCALCLCCGVAGPEHVRDVARCSAGGIQRSVGGIE